MQRSAPEIPFRYFRSPRARTWTRTWDRTPVNASLLSGRIRRGKLHGHVLRVNRTALDYTYIPDQSRKQGPGAATAVRTAVGPNSARLGRCRARRVVACRRRVG